MANIAPELEGWDEIRSRPAHGDALGIVDATHRLVVSITNLRLAVSAKVGYLNDKVERLQGSLEKMNQSFVDLNKNIKAADASSTKLATALNYLTFCAVAVAVLAVGEATIQFLYENQIWPFIQ